MEDSEDSPYDDVWSPSLRENVFSGQDIGSSWNGYHYHENHLPLPAPLATLFPPSLNLNHIDYPNPYTLRNHHSASAKPSSSQSTSSTPLPRNHSHLDLPNFPLQASPIGNTSNSSGRPLPTSTLPPHRTNPPTTHEPPPTRQWSEDTFLSSDSSEREDTPWLYTETLGDFVDLTADETPSNMPPTHSQRRLAKPPVSRHHSDTSSNPAKRRKTEEYQSSGRSKKLEEVDLRDVDDDKGLSEVLEQQRLATIKAQQEQASRPVKLSTIQCIICMESMKDLTATHCGHLFCHTCLMEALIAGENQGPEPGKGVPKCPVCRKKVVRPTDRKDNHNVVPLSMKLKVKPKVDKGKCKAI